MERFWSKVTQSTADKCWLWSAARSTSKYGLKYGRFFYEGKNVKAHRVAYELSHGSVPVGLVVRHKCDISLCCNPAHLEVGSVADNNADMVTRGRNVPARGTMNPRAKLTAEKVIEIRARDKGGERRADLAKHFGCSERAIIDAITGNTWWYV